jgi:hypothetical protein
VSTPRVAPNNWPSGWRCGGVTRCARIRKGTVAAFLANARTWTRADASESERLQAQARIAEDLPALSALGLFEVLEFRDDRLRAWFDAAIARGEPQA